MCAPGHVLLRGRVDKGSPGLEKPVVDVGDPAWPQVAIGQEKKSGSRHSLLFYNNENR